MRVKTNVPAKKKKKRLFRDVKGAYGARKNIVAAAKETRDRAWQFAFRDRRAKKRSFRQLWIIRLTAACKMHGLRYSEFINGLTKAGIELNRKSLSDLAVLYPEVFETIVAEVKTALGK